MDLIRISYRYEATSLHDDYFLQCAFQCVLMLGTNRGLPERFYAVPVIGSFFSETMQVSQGIT